MRLEKKKKIEKAILWLCQQLLSISFHFYLCKKEEKKKINFYNNYGYNKGKKKKEKTAAVAVPNASVTERKKNRQRQH